MYKRYVSVKWVEVDTEQRKIDDTGRIYYRVRYSDTYESWVPEDIFKTGQYISAEELGIDINQLTQ